MRSRFTLLLGAVTAGALVTGVAWAAMPTTTAIDTMFEVGDAGTVVVVTDGAQVAIDEVVAAAGWRYEIGSSVGVEAQVDFWSGDRRVRFTAELEDGEIRSRVREIVEGDSTVDTATTGGSTGTPASVAPTTTVGDTTSTSGVGSTSTTADDTTSTTTGGDSTSTTAGNTTSTTTGGSTTTTVGNTTSTTNGGSTSTTVGNTTSTTVDDSEPIGSGSQTYSVGGAATVSIAWSNGTLTLVSVSVASGWEIDDQEVRSDRIEIDFESGDNDARFRADFHDGALRIETRVD
jgi:hypothetical protein